MNVLIIKYEGDSDTGVTVEISDGHMAVVLVRFPRFAPLGECLPALVDAALRRQETNSERAKK